jgi:hypothetical protein
MRYRLLALSTVGLLSVVWAPPAAGATPGASIVAWGCNYEGQASPPAGEDFIAVAAGGGHSLALRTDGSIAGWGLDGDGQASPPAGGGFVAVAAGFRHSLALREDGSIAGWGRDGYGQASPPAGDGFVAIAAGEYHSLALRDDGSIVGWGRDDQGQASPPAGDGFVAIAAGGFHSLALRADGSIVGWGRDDWGQASSPAGDDFVAVGAGEYHSVALRDDGSLVGWGWNHHDQASPPEGNDFVALTSGAYHGLALRGDWSMAGWGGNDWGGNECGQATPQAGNAFIAISAGMSHSLALVVGGPPGAFEKIAPPSAATGQGAAARLSWVRAPGAVLYEYCIDTTGDDACGNWVYLGTAAAVEVGGLADRTTYFWQVRAHNPVGATDADEGAWWSFTTGPPEVFGKTTPPDGATNQSGLPLLSWEGVSGADSYEYCVDTTDDDACAGSWVGVGTDDSVRIVGLAYETAHYWQVRAANDFGTVYADGGPWWSFTTKPTPPIEKLSFRSNWGLDGWILENAEDSGKGGARNSWAITARVGDDEFDRQYRSILDFDTAGLPDDAVVVGVTIRIKRESVTGTHPLLTHGMLKVDVKAGAYHDGLYLESYDFHAIGSRGNVGRFLKALVDGWYRAPLRESSFPLVNLTGHTQFRLRFALDDNDDVGADYLSFWSGDAPTETDRPELIVDYYVP